MKPLHSICLLGMLITSLLAIVPQAPAADTWLQWGGANRDFTVADPGLAEAWPAEGPRVVWSGEIEAGHSSIVTDGKTLYTMCRRDEQDAVVAFNAETGEKLWETRYDAPTKPDMQLEFGAGPHSTPLIVGERLFTLGGMVHFHCLDRATGKVLWAHNLMDELGAAHCGRGYGASPFAYKDLVIVGCGGGDVGVAAFRQDTGEIAWKSEKFRPGYPSPVLAQVSGEEHLIYALSAERMALDPATGQTRWKTTVDRQLAGIMSSPLWVGPDSVLFSCAYGGGTQLFRIGRKDDAYAAEEVWFNNKLKVMHGTLVRIGEHVFGSSGDFGPAFMMCVHLPTGKLLWRDRTFAKATLLAVGDKLLILDAEGRLALARPTAEKLNVLVQTQVLKSPSFTSPTLVGARLYLRDHHTIKALELPVAAGSKSE
ncbi:MAG: PQQ-binding-like beta-propeller repeat protein [Planctomycetota bacterium]